LILFLPISSVTLNAVKFSLPIALTASLYASASDCPFTKMAPPIATHYSCFDASAFALTLIASAFAAEILTDVASPVAFLTDASASLQFELLGLPLQLLLAYLQLQFFFQESVFELCFL
jgi:hypothetical protein